MTSAGTERADLVGKSFKGASTDLCEAWSALFTAAKDGYLARLTPLLMPLLVRLNSILERRSRRDEPR